MKKAIYLFLLVLSAFITHQSYAQSASFTTSPGTGQCYTAGGNYGYAGFNNTISATSFSWTVSGPGCNPGYTVSSTALPYISIYYPCCGIYTITCHAFTGTTVTTYTRTYNVYCAGSLNVTGASGICSGSSGYLYASGGGNYFWQPGNLTGSSIVVSPTATTCYTVTSTDSLSGCYASAVKCVSVFPSNITISGGNSPICSGSYAVLNASGATTYTWYPSGTTGSSLLVTPGSTSCYTVQGYNANCGTLSFAVKCVTVVPSPSISVSGNTAVCPGGGATLTASGANTYSWMYGSSAFTGSTVVISPTASTCFSLIGTNSNGCYGVTGVCLSTQGGLNLSVSGNTVICSGSGATLTASGAQSYTWSPGLTGSSIVVSPSVSTCYTVVGSNSVGCTGSAAICVNVQSSSSVGVQGTSSLCAGSSGTLFGYGGTSYTWNPGNIVNNGQLVITPSVNTCYTMTTNGYCGLVTVVKCVTVSTTNGSLSISGPNSLCSGNYGTLTATGGNTYTWYPGGSTNNALVITPTASTCYTVVATGCAGNQSGSHCVTVGGANLSVSGNTALCSGSSSTLTVSGAQNYTWSTGNTGSSIVVTPTASTCYSVVGTTTTGCLGYGSICINVQSSSSVGIQGPSTLCAGSSATLFGYGGTSYTWNPGNIVNNGQLVITPSVNTCYTMTTNGYCGLVTVVKCVSVSTSNGSMTISGPTSLCSGSYGTLTASGANSYTWYPGGSAGPGIVVTPTASTCYTVVGASCAGNISAVRCISVSPSPVISVTGSTYVCPGSTGTLNASGATSYTWYGSNGTYTGSSIVFTANATTCFSVMGSNGNGCYGYGGLCVTPQSPVSVSGATSICSGNSATLIASGSASGYSWQPGGMTGSVVVVSPTASVCYTVNSTSTTGCSGYAVHCIQVNPKPTLFVYPTATLCIGQPAALIASGASSYTWLPSNTTGATLAITPTANNCYTVIGMNTWGCKNTAVSCFSAYPAASITISGSNINCGAQSTTLTASGATNYYWLPGGLTGSSIVVSPTAGVCYTVTGYPSGQMCPGTAVRCLSVSGAPVVSVSGNTNICAGSSTGLSASGASTYTWIPGNLTGSFVTVSPSVSTCYTVVGTNANGCIGVNKICINVLARPNIITSGNIICQGQSDTISAYGASTYTWFPFGYTGQHIVVTPTASGCFTVVGTNSAGCTNTTAGCYTVVPNPSITISGANSTCAGGSITLVASGGWTYSWAPTGSTNNSIVVSPSVSTCYTVTGSGPYGCISKAVKCVSVQPGAFVTISGSNVLCGGTSANLLASGANSYTWSNGATGAFITVSPSVSTCYTVTGQTSGGCIGTAVKCITVQNVPSLSVSGNTNICQGSSTTLQATGAASYWWNTGATSSAIVVSPGFNTSYMVVGSNGGCTSSVSINVTVRPKPFVFILGGDSSTVCAGDALTLTAVGASTYTWNTGSTGPMITVTPTASTVYSVVGTSTNNCSNSAAKMIVVSLCTGIAANTMSDSDVQVYPNPSSGVITISSKLTETVNVKVYDMIGRELIKKQISGTQNIDLSSFANGTYILRFEKGDKTMYKKVVIE